MIKPARLLLTIGTAIGLVVATSTTASAVTLATTGAEGRYAFTSGPPYNVNLYATDTLSDGHCARWQVDYGSGYQWLGAQVCSSTETFVGTYPRATQLIRICRTGVGNCSPAKLMG